MRRWEAVEEAEEDNHHNYVYVPNERWSHCTHGKAAKKSSFLRLKYFAQLHFNFSCTWIFIIIIESRIQLNLQRYERQRKNKDKYGSENCHRKYMAVFYNYYHCWHGSENDRYWNVFSVNLNESFYFFKLTYFV